MNPAVVYHSAMGKTVQPNSSSNAGLSKLRPRAATEMKPVSRRPALQANSSDELHELIQDNPDVLNGKIPVRLPAKGDYDIEILDGCPVLIVEQGSSMIISRAECSPVIEVRGNASPLIVAYDTSKPVIDIYGQAEVEIQSDDTSSPTINCYGEHEPVIVS